jgi:hypothetical protein
LRLNAGSQLISRTADTRAFRLAGQFAPCERRFQAAVAFHRRLLALEAQLEAERWRAKSPVILPEGWPDPTPPST